MLEANDFTVLRHVPIKDGDLVCLDHDVYELYSVIIVRDDRAWLRNLDTGMDTLSSVRNCRRIGHEAEF